MPVHRMLGSTFHGRSSLEPAICCPGPDNGGQRPTIRSFLTSLLAWKLEIARNCNLDRIKDDRKQESCLYDLDLRTGDDRMSELG
uniref:Uncharacterized protein n=1 Tax=Zea mays TaxID=4577 RepID=B4FJM5_MAIZE|nr:unknown [Zea mays]